jgi:hypothetical protein
LPSQEQVAVMSWITCVLRPFEVWGGWIASRSVSIILNLSAPSKRSQSKAHWPWPDKLHNVQNWSKQIAICNIVEICQDMSRYVEMSSYVEICRDMSRYVEICQDDRHLIPSDTIWSPHWSQIFGNKCPSPPATRGVFASETENVSLSAQRPEGSDMALSDGSDGEKNHEMPHFFRKSQFPHLVKLLVHQLLHGPSQHFFAILWKRWT